jgi:phospholipase/lecithinase/hemolysin
VKNLLPLTIAFSLLALASFPAQAGFSALYVFGDGVCTTTDNSSTGPLYYGHRYSNGRIWLEVLAQRQGVIYDAAKNNSYYNDFSAIALVNVNSFVVPADATNDLFVVWVCDADFVGDLGQFNPPYTVANTPPWNNNISQSLNNHFTIVTNLYAKGVRYLVMPNAVDLGKIPEYDGLDATSKSFVRGRIIYFNTNFTATLNQAKALCPGLQIYVPDFFSVFDNVITNATLYGLTNALDFNGQSIDAIDALPNAAINGPGTNYIFWDPVDPTARLHAVMADIVQQIISPVQIGKLASLVGSNRLDIVNYPAGLNGFVDGLTNLTLTNWSAMLSITSTNTTQSAVVSTSGPQQFYRLRFPYAWRWP